jgi:hypothetical protein
VEAVLAARGFSRVATGALSFAELLAAFQGAEMVFGVMLSDLANLILLVQMKVSCFMLKPLRRGRAPVR